MHLFGNLGHIVILAPLALALIGYLISVGARRDAFAFAAALIACLGTTLFTKLFFEVCGARVPVFQIESPSGHESFSAAVYGGLAVLVATGRPKVQQAVIYAAAAVLILLIGLARVATGAHTPEEVEFGLLIGVASTVLFRALRRDTALLPIPWREIALLSPFVAILALAALVLVSHWTPEYVIDAVGKRFGAHFGLCV
jgi:membrane-associated phospholipid phosphatase